MKKSEILQIIEEEIYSAIIPESADQSHRLNEAAMYKKGQRVQYQIDRGSSRALKPSTGTISKVQKKGNSYMYTIQDGGPVPAHELEIIALTEASAKDKFNAPPMNKWWTGDKEALMSAIYHAQRQLPPTNKADYEKNWKSIVNQLQKKYPAPTAIFKKRLNEAVSPKKAAEVLFDKLAAAKLIGKQNRRRAVGVIEYMIARMNFNESVNEAKVNYNFSEDELKRVIKQLKRNASTEVNMIKAFEKAFGRKLTRDELFEAKKIKPHDLGYRINARRAMGDFKRGENIAAVSKSGKGSFKIEDIDDFRKYHPKFWDFAYIVKESVTEALARGLKPLLTLGSKVSWKTMSEDALLDLSDKFDRIDDEVAEDVASYLNIAIENKQDGKQGLATKALKAFNKACKDALAGKAVKSVFEGKLTEATSLWKHFDAKMKLQDEIMDLEYDMKMINKDLSQLHKDMEQEAEPAGGKIADRYGREIDKKEKEYKKKKADFKKLMAKLDRMEQY